MKITSLIQTKKDNERVNVYVDGKFEIALDKNTIIQENLFVDKEISAETISKLKDSDSFNYIYRRILDWNLSHPRSSKEVFQKIKDITLKRKSKSFNNNIDITSVYNFVVKKLEENGFNNQTYAKWLIENRINQAKYGKQRILSELVIKGVNKNIAITLLNISMPSDKHLAVELLKKRYNVTSIKQIKDFNLRAKAYRYLASKGLTLV